MIPALLKQSSACNACVGDREPGREIKQQGSKAGSKQAGRGKYFDVSQTWKRVLTRAVTTLPQWA